MSDASRNARGLHRLRRALSPVGPRLPQPPKGSSLQRDPALQYPLSAPLVPPLAISSINTKRGIHSDVRVAPPSGRQTGAGGQWGSDTIQHLDSHPTMTISSVETISLEPDPGINHRASLSPPQSLSRTSRATSPVRGSTSSSFTAVQGLFDKLRPTETVKRYERSVKLEGPFIDVDLPPLTTSFDE